MCNIFASLRFANRFRTPLDFIVGQPVPLMSHLRLAYTCTYDPSILFGCLILMFILYIQSRLFKEISSIPEYFDLLFAGKIYNEIVLQSR